MRQSLIDRCLPAKTCDFTTWTEGHKCWSPRRCSGNPGYLLREVRLSFRDRAAILETARSTSSRIVRGSETVFVCFGYCDRARRSACPSFATRWRQAIRARSRSTRPKCAPAGGHRLRPARRALRRAEPQAGSGRVTIGVLSSAAASRGCLKEYSACPPPIRIPEHGFVFYTNQEQREPRGWRVGVLLRHHRGGQRRRHRAR